MTDSAAARSPQDEDQAREAAANAIRGRVSFHEARTLIDMAIPAYLAARSPQSEDPEA